MTKMFLTVALWGCSFAAFGAENIAEFFEVYTSKTCRESKEIAAERVAKQAASGSDIYNGGVAAYSGKKIVRFIQNDTRCEAVYSETEGMLFNYYLRVQVDMNS